MLLVGPFLYFYIRGVLNDQYNFKLKDGLHFIPAIIHLVGITPYLFTSFEYKENIAKQILGNLNVLKQLNLNLFFRLSLIL